MLDPEHLKVVLLVCKTWKKAGERPELWANMCLKISKSWKPVPTSVLSLKRLTSLKSVYLTGTISNKTLTGIHDHPHIESLNINGDLSCVDPKNLAFTLRGVKTANLKFCGYEIGQLTTLMEGLAGKMALAGKKVTLPGQSKLTSLKFNCRDGDMFLVEPSILANALANLEDLDMYLTEDQWAAVVPALGTNLKKLDMCFTRLTSVAPGHLAHLVTRLEVVNLEKTKLTTQQVQAVCKALGKTSPKEVILKGNDLSSVEPGVLAAMVTKAKLVDLRTCLLTRDQVEAVLTAVVDTSSVLRKLKLSLADVVGVEEEMVRRAMNSLVLLELSHEVDLVEQVELMEQVNMVEQGNLVEQGELAEQVDLVEQVEQVDLLEQVDLVEQVEHAEQVDLEEQVDLVEQVEQVNLEEPVEQFYMAEEGEDVDQEDQVEHVEQVDRMEHVEQVKPSEEGTENRPMDQPDNFGNLSLVDHGDQQGGTNVQLSVVKCDGSKGDCRNKDTLGNRILWNTFLCFEKTFM